MKGGCDCRGQVWAMRTFPRKGDCPALLCSSLFLFWRIVLCIISTYTFHPRLVPAPSLTVALRHYQHQVGV